MKLKTIPLYPTDWRLDVWIGYHKIAQCFNKRYGASIEYYQNQFSNGDNEYGTCGRINSTIDSELKGEYIIVVTLRSFKLNILVHELSHAFDKLCNAVKLEVEPTEWKACMIEYMFKNAKNTEDYKTYMP